MSSWNRDGGEVWAVSCPPCLCSVWSWTYSLTVRFHFSFTPDILVIFLKEVIFRVFFSCLGSTIVLPCFMTRTMVLMWYSLKYHLKSLYRNMVTIKSISEYHDYISWHYNSTMVPPQVHNRKCQGRSLSNSSIKSYWLLKLSKMPI